jgi:predicted nucleotidyltransferase
MCAENSKQSVALAIAQRITRKFASMLQVEAVAMAGSRISGSADGASDVDLYVYVTEDIRLDERSRIAAGAPHAEIGNATWEPGDEWIDYETGTPIDVMFRHLRWIEEQLDRVLVQHQASVGYSTCFWYNVLHSRALFDRRGWFADLQKRAAVTYPPQLRKAIIAKNYPLLRRNQSSYLHQIELAIKRNDPVSVNHRVAALLASYFDVLFALNELPHPGEKRLLEHATASCKKLPVGMERQVRELLVAIATADGRMAERINTLVNGLDDLLAREE